jgi:hypothetical protein
VIYVCEKRKTPNGIHLDLKKGKGKMKRKEKKDIKRKPNKEERVPSY